MTLYARGTEVSVERSEGEIKRTLIRYGADDVVTGQSARMRVAFVQFQYRDLPIELRIPLPDPEDDVFWLSPGGKRRRKEDQARAAWEKACRQQWRVLLLLIKANLEAVENDLMPAQEVFLPWLLLADGRTVGKVLEPEISAFLSSGKVPKRLTFTEGAAAKRG